MKLHSLPAFVVVFGPGLAIIEKLKAQGVKIETLKTPGGHEWANWRLYLREIAPKLFR